MARRPTMILHSIADLRRAMRAAEYDTVRLAALTGRSKSLIGYLYSGARTSTGEATAHAIEDALSVSRGALFYPFLSAGSDNNGETVETLLKPKEAAQRMGCSESHVRRLMADGELTVSDIARAGARQSKSRIPSTSVLAYMRRQEQPRPPRTA
ncbi:helix-turn-helix domain-containing protein [Streptosporangium sp. NPDC051022]|uniref:helix-turn-helix domain-containing protein n=1 Tax=Streptosporangium sp. NPDC051022 TaxID=3155752 RepID=UPI0034477925